MLESRSFRVFRQHISLILLLCLAATPVHNVLLLFEVSLLCQAGTLQPARAMHAVQTLHPIVEASNGNCPALRRRHSSVLFDNIVVSCSGFVEVSVIMWVHHLISALIVAHLFIDPRFSSYGSIHKYLHHLLDSPLIGKIKRHQALHQERLVVHRFETCRTGIKKG